MGTAGRCVQTRDNSYQCWGGKLRGLSLLAVEGGAVGGAAKSSHHWVGNDDHNSAALWAEEAHVRNRVLISAEIINESSTWLLYLETPVSK